jgi:hypothetical protein
LYEGRVTTHTDQYALAVTYCELVTGGRVLVPANQYRPPLTPPVDLKKLRSNEYPVIARALDPNWTGRFPNCKCFVSALREAVQKPRSSNNSKKGSREALVSLRRP